MTVRGMKVLSNDRNSDRSDADLALMAAQGLNGAFDDLFARHHYDLRAHLRRKLKNPHDVEDASQETWYRVYSDLERFDPAKGGFIHWLRGYANNVAREFTRRRQRLHMQATDDIEFMAAELDMLVGNGPPRDARATSEAMDAIRGLARLRGSLRSPLLMNVVDDVGPTELSALLDITLGAAKQRLYRARRLARELAARPGTDAEPVRPLLAEGVFEVGRVYLRADRGEDAQRWLVRSMDLDPRCVDWTKNLSQLTVRHSVENPVLLSALESALQRHPDNQHIATEYANLVRNHIGWNEALPHYEAAQSLDATNAHAAVLTAIAHLVVGDPADAWRTIEPFLTPDQVDPEVPMTASEALAGMGERRAARLLLRPMRERVEGADPDSVLPGRLPNYSRIYTAGRFKLIGHVRASIGDIDDARDAYRRAIDIFRELPETGMVQQREIDKCVRGLDRCDAAEGTNWTPGPLGPVDY